jgi:hopene-associated glycosyltransferase HpnB
VHLKLLFISAIPLAIWLYLFLARGFFWRLRAFDADRSSPKSLSKWPSVTVIVPARNEAATIARVVASLVRQDYGGEFSVVVVDDHSEDGTSALAQNAAAAFSGAERVSVHAAAVLPAGWTGKLWALNEGVTRAAESAAEFYWFTDADIVHLPETLRRLVARAGEEKLDLVSLMVLLRAETVAERFLIPPFVYFFLKLYPPRWIADSNARTAGAAGGCVLLRREALERIGGIAAIRGEVIDDCALARAVKKSGGKIWLGLTRASRSLRGYGSFGEIRDMIARTAFTQLRYSTILLLGTLIGMLLTYVAPVALLLVANPFAKIFGAASWAMMTLTFLPTLRFYRISPLWAPLLPLVALFYSYATWLSALRYWRGRGGQWKGRAQAPRTS